MFVKETAESIYKFIKSEVIGFSILDKATVIMLSEDVVKYKTLEIVPAFRQKEPCSVVIQDFGLLVKLLNQDWNIVAIDDAKLTLKNETGIFYLGLMDIDTVDSATLGSIDMIPSGKSVNINIQMFIKSVSDILTTFPKSKILFTKDKELQIHYMSDVIFKLPNVLAGPIPFTFEFDTSIFKIVNRERDVELKLYPDSNALCAVFSDKETKVVSYRNSTD